MSIWAGLQRAELCPAAGPMPRWAGLQRTELRSPTATEMPTRPDVQWPGLRTSEFATLSARLRSQWVCMRGPSGAAEVPAGTHFQRPKLYSPAANLPSRTGSQRPDLCAPAAPKECSLHARGSCQPRVRRPPDSGARPPRNATRASRREASRQRSGRAIPAKPVLDLRLSAAAWQVLHRSRFRATRRVECRSEDRPQDAPTPRRHSTGAGRRQNRGRHFSARWQAQLLPLVRADGGPCNARRARVRRPRNGSCAALPEVTSRISLGGALRPCYTDKGVSVPLASDK